jgi:methionyl-tRNA synthetase
MPRLEDVEDLDGGPSYPVVRGDYAAGQAIWDRTPIAPGTPIAAPTPLFTKLDASVIDEELARLESGAG